MSEKTILRLHANGDFEAIDTPLMEGERYSFSADYIKVPTVVKLRKEENLFKPEESVAGYINESNGQIATGYEYDRASGFIAVKKGQTIKVESSYKDIINARPWVCLCFYDANRAYVSTLFARHGLYGGASEGTYTNIFNVPEGVHYIRFSTNLYTHPTTQVTIVIKEDGGVPLPYWAKDTGNPVSFFPEGVVIKGDLITSAVQPAENIILSDDFNRSELGSNWIVARGGWTIENGVLKATTSNNILLSAKKHRDNVSISADMKRNVSEGLIIRGTDATNILYVQFEYQNLRVKSTKNGTTTTLSSYTLNSSTSTFYRTKVEMRGTEIKVFIDDTLRITVNTSEHLGQYTSGFQCWSDSSAVGRFDNLEIRSL